MKRLLFNICLLTAIIACSLSAMDLNDSRVEFTIRNATDKTAVIKVCYDVPPLPVSDWHTYTLQPTGGDTQFTAMKLPMDHLFGTVKVEVGSDTQETYFYEPMNLCSCLTVLPNDDTKQQYMPAPERSPISPGALTNGKVGIIFLPLPSQSSELSTGPQFSRKFSKLESSLYNRLTVDRIYKLTRFIKFDIQKLAEDLEGRFMAIKTIHEKYLMHLSRYQRQFPYNAFGMPECLHVVDTRPQIKNPYPYCLSPYVIWLLHNHYDDQFRKVHGPKSTPDIRITGKDITLLESKLKLKGFPIIDHTAVVVESVDDSLPSQK